MLYLESFVHRVPLAEVVSRWIVNQPEPGDVAQLKRIVNFNSYIARIWVDGLARTVLAGIHGQAPRSMVAKTKGQLKDFIVDNPFDDSERTRELVARYRRYPEDFYRETPFDGRLYYIEQDVMPHKRYVGSTRIKRFRRIAEKGSRRIVDYMFERIRANADALAEERAKRLGIPKHELITPPAQQVEEFLHAERRLLKMIRRGSIQHEFPILSIPDVVGIKIIADEKQYERIVETLQDHPSCTLIEQEHHTGRYNAINLRVAYKIPRDQLIASTPNAHHRRVLSFRGFDPETVAGEYRQFVETAEDHVLLEIIVAGTSEFMESEIGRSMHEDRIVQQRSHASYSGHLATNVMYLMDYLLVSCLAPSRREVSDVPIKLWVKYMEDTMDRLKRALFNVPVDASFEEVDDPAQDKPAAPARLRSVTPPPSGETPLSAAE
ncbi:MAG: hypothetical protein KC503_41230 [Myxococcales bacterium]|nr:hypothetical protein [Myxococcales bacterium]